MGPVVLRQQLPLRLPMKPTITKKNAPAFLGKTPAVLDLVFFELANNGKDGRLAASVKYPFFPCGHIGILAENGLLAPILAYCDRPD